MSSGLTVVLVATPSGRAAAGLARRLGLAVGNDTSLRLVRRRARRPAEAPTVIGADDWAPRRKQRYVP